MRVVTAIVFVVLLIGIAACGNRETLINPPAPSVVPPPPPDAPARGTGLAVAVVELSNLRVTVTPPWTNNPYYAHGVRFRLTEITGKSGATITNIAVSAGTETANTGPSCWLDAIRVGPSATLDTFDTGSDELAYCAPFVGSRVTESSVLVTVSYSDDDGRAGSVVARVAVTR